MAEYTQFRAVPPDPTVDVAHDTARTLLGRTMALVALTAVLFGVGALSGRNLPGLLGLASLLAAVGVLIGMHVAVAKAATPVATALLAAFGFLMGLGSATSLSAYANVDPVGIWQAALATALFIAGVGTWGYATRRDLSGVARAAMWALLALIVFGVVLIFVQIPNGALVYGVAGLVIFAALTAFDFQRLRRETDVQSAPLLAASIFLDVLNVFLLFLDLFTSDDER